MFKCKVCLEKDKRISDLKAQIDYYQKLLNPRPTLPAVHIEANKIMDGANEPVFVVDDKEDHNPEQVKEREAINYEFDSIVSGNY